MVEDWVWDGPDDLPGSGVTLALLYYFVPVTEEVDLLDHLHRERRQSSWRSLCGEFAGIDDEVDGAENCQVEEGDEQGDTAEMPMSIGQILGMLAHLLGAEIIDELDLEEGKGNE
jgi:hypothetical protein